MDRDDIILLCSLIAVPLIVVVVTILDNVLNGPYVIYY